MSPSVELMELDMHINDPAFATTAAEKLLGLIAKVRRG
jgi:hypothetical protein